MQKYTKFRDSNQNLGRGIKTKDEMSVTLTKCLSENHLPCLFLAVGGHTQHIDPVRQVAAFQPQRRFARRQPLCFQNTPADIQQIDRHLFIGIFHRHHRIVVRGIGCYGEIHTVVLIHTGQHCQIQRDDAVTTVDRGQVLRVSSRRAGIETVLRVGFPCRDAVVDGDVVRRVHRQGQRVNGVVGCVRVAAGCGVVAITELEGLAVANALVQNDINGINYHRGVLRRIEIHGHVVDEAARENMGGVGLAEPEGDVTACVGIGGEIDLFGFPAADAALAPYGIHRHKGQ